MENYPLHRYNQWFSIVPDWICEVLSPTTRSLDLGKKRDIYARKGVPHLWIVDPKALTLQSYALSHGKLQLIATLAEAETVSVPPFETMNMPLSRLWKETYKKPPARRR